jgi:glucose/arabinose dehydrogenase
MRLRLILIAALLLPGSVALAAGPPRAVAAADQCFPATGRCVGGLFYQYWQANGGLAQQGYPISDELDEVSPTDGKTYRTQYFERARFELHPENAGTPYEVLLGLLGREQYQAKYPGGRPPGGAGDVCFAATGRCVRGIFYQYWQANGGLAQQGYPLSDEFDEVSPTNGRSYRVQYFERARFEYHPENAGTAYEVLLGLLGREQRGITDTNPGFDAALVALDLEEVAGGLDEPLFVTHAGDGSGRLFVAEKGGTIRTLPGGQTFLDISGRVGSGGEEQGLLGLAFHPRFRDNGYFYVNYTDPSGDTVIARYGLTPDRQRGDPNSEKRLLFQKQPAANHNGGMLAFGPDGYLYLGLGDGGGANDQFRNAQNRQALLGKLLRVDVDRGDPYAIPPDNPFAGDPAARPEVWAYGLRNPWRFSFDRATRDLYIGDVGQNRYEWVEFQPAGSAGGQNYGWPIVEGGRCLRGDPCDKTGLTLPVASYDHSLGCSIIGGYVYRGARYPLLQGAYLLGDYCSGRVWTLARDGAGRWVLTQMLQTGAPISSFGEDEAGEVYLTDLAAGRVYRLTARPR